MANILLVENNDMQANLLQRYLNGRHTVIGQARTVDEAVDLFRSADPDAVVMDLKLDDGNGITATKEITAADPTVAVIISTVDVGEETKAEAAAAGADEYLFKPYERTELLDAIERALG